VAASSDSYDPVEPSSGPSQDLVLRLAGLRHDPEPAPTMPNARYEFGPVFASGGLGKIRRAYDRRLCRDVAVKELRHYQPGSIGEQRFLREAWITARLEHPAIVPIHDIDRHPGGEPFFCMHLVEGTSLDTLVRTRKTLAERLALVAHVIAVADALAYAHDRGVVHRDLKPSNVLIGAFGETVVIDWGLAKELSEPHSPEPATPSPASSEPDLTQTGEFVGTLPFMPPEQTRGAEASTRADVYAIGAILYHVLSGQIPYAQETAHTRLAALLAGPPRDLATLEPRISPDLLAIIHKAMARAPADRYASAKQLAEDLRRFQEGRLVAARTYRIRDLLRHFILRHRRLLEVAALGVVLLATLAVYSYAQVVARGRDADEQRAQAVRAQEAEQAARALAERGAREAQALAVQQLIEVGRRLLHDEHAPQRALVPLVRAYHFDRTRRDLRRLLREATSWTDNLELVIRDVESFSYSDSGASLVTVGRDDSFAVWDTRTGETIYRVAGGAPLWVVDFLPGAEDRLLFVSETGLRRYDRDVLVWDTRVPDYRGVLRGTTASRALLSTPTEDQWIDLATGALKRIPGARLPGERHEQIVWWDDRALAHHLPTVQGAPVEPWTGAVLQYDPSGRVLGHRRYSRAYTHAPKISPDGRTLSYVQGDQVVLDDVVTGRRRTLEPCGEVDTRRLKPYDHDARFSPDGSALIRLLGDRQLARWSTADLSCEAQVADLGDNYEHLYQTEDGGSLILAGKTGRIAVLDPETLSIREEFVAETTPIVGLDINPRSDQIAVKNARGELRIWRLGDPRLLDSQPLLDLTPGARPGETIALVDDDTGRRLVALRVPAASAKFERLPFSGTTSATQLEHHDQHRLTVEALTINYRDPTRIAGYHEVWDIEARLRIPPRPAWTTSGCITPCLHTALNELAAAGLATPDHAAPRCLDRWTLAPTARGLSFYEPHEVPASLWDLESGVHIGYLDGQYGNFSPDGRYIYTGRVGVDIQLYDSATGAHLRELVSESRDVRYVVDERDPAVTFSADGELFAVPLDRGAILLWDAETLVQIGELAGHFDEAKRLEFGPTSEHLLSTDNNGNSDRQTFLWDLETLTGVSLDVADVTAVAFSPGADLLALGSQDGVIRLWDTRTSSQVGELRGHTRPIHYLEFARDDRLVSAARDDRVLLWQVEEESRSPADLDHHMRSTLSPDLLKIP